MRGLGALAFTYLALMALLAATVSASFVLSGTGSFATGIVIAVAKAALIIWIFMQLRAESGLARIAALGAVAFLLLLFVLSWTDYATR